MKRIIISLLVLLIACTQLAFAQETGNDSQNLATDKIGAQQFEGFNLEGYTDDGAKAWDVEGDSADIQGADIVLKNVNANTYGDSKMNVVAKTGKVNQVTGYMELEKDVVITNEDGSQLTTDSLQWSRENDLVTTKDPVMINNDQITVTGKGLEARPGLSKAEIHKDVRAMVDTKTQKKEVNTVTITSDGPMTIDQTLYLARFEENVFAIQDDQTLNADAVEIYFNEEMNSILKMVCTGHVKVIQGDNQTFAQKAVYDASTKKLVLTGRPKLILVTEGENILATSGN